MQNSGGHQHQENFLNSKHSDYSVASGCSEFVKFPRWAASRSYCFDWLYVQKLLQLDMVTGSASPRRVPGRFQGILVS
jgi:hypothetical protein